MSASVRVEGLPRLRAALLGLSGVGQKVVAREVKRAALNVEGGAKERSPVDTGRLRASIAHEIQEGGLSALVGTNVEYAPHQEFGTQRMAAQPFLFPALEAERPVFLARLRSELGDAFVKG